MKISIEKLALSVLILISGLLLFLEIKDGHSWDSDFAMYVGQAKGLIDGGLKDLYFDNLFTRTHSVHPFGPLFYPFGQPLLLAPIYGLFGLNFLAFKYYLALFAIGTIPFLYRIISPLFKNQGYTYALIACFFFNPDFIKGSDLVLSDYPYLFFSFWALSRFNSQSSSKDGIILGVLIFFSYLIRDVGLLLIPSLMIFQLAHSDPSSRFKLDLRKILPYATFITAFLVHLLVQIRFPSKHFERIWEGQGLESILGNILFYEDMVSSYLLTWDTPAFSAFLPLFLLLLLGAWSIKKRSAHLFIYCILITGVIIIWPHKQGERFWYPTLPIFLLFIFKGIEVLSEKKEGIKWVGVSFVGIWALIVLAKGTIDLNQRWNKDSNLAMDSEMNSHYEFIKENIPIEEPVVFFKPRVLRLFTERKSHFLRPEEFYDHPSKFYLISQQKELQNARVIYSGEKYNLWEKIE